MIETVNSHTDLQVDDSYLLVESDASLLEWCETWQHSDYLAMDTEFIRTSTFFPHVGLIQVNAGTSENVLIDPLTINDWSRFRELMVDEKITKIFHSCSEDLQVFMFFLGLVPAPLFDTQIASALLDEGFGTSYQNLVKFHLGLDLPKGETRSDWLQRPLDKNQLHYAALDVACLPVIYREQLGKLEELGRLHWLRQECSQLLALYEKELEGDFSGYYINIRGAWQLDRNQLGLLKLLAEWRELRARKRDKPRNWIIKDKSLLEIARSFPSDMNALANVEDLGRNFLRHEGREVLELVAKAQQGSEEELPAQLPRPLDGKSKNRLKKGQQFVEGRAKELGLPVEMLSRKRWLVELLQALLDAEKNSLPKSMDQIPLPQEFAGWRHPLLFPDLFAAMSFSVGNANG